jgi:hypothetical protein
LAGHQARAKELEALTARSCAPRARRR